MEEQLYRYIIAQQLMWEFHFVGVKSLETQSKNSNKFAIEWESLTFRHHKCDKLIALSTV